MKPRGIRKIFQDKRHNFIALCKDGSLWITRDIDVLGNAKWKKVDSIPKQDYEGAM